MTAAAQVPAVRPKLETGASVAAIVPRSFEEAFRLAGAISASGLAPRGMDKPEQVAVAIIAGAELGLPPFQAIQSFAVVNGRPTLWGDGLVAVVRAQGVKIRDWFEGEGDALTARCEVTRPDSGETIAGEFSVADARKANLWGKAGPWQQYPRRMLKMRARAFALRDGCADMLRGFQVREEVEDYQAVEVREVRPAPAQTLAAEAALPPARFEIVDAPEPVEVEPRDAVTETHAAPLPPEAASQEPQPEPPSDAAAPTLSQQAVRKFGVLEDTVRAAATKEELTEAWSSSGTLRSVVAEAQPERVQALEETFNARMALFEDGAA